MKSVDNGFRGCFDLRQDSELATKNISSNFTDSEKADLSSYSTDEPDFSTAIEEADSPSPDANSSGKSTGEGN